MNALERSFWGAIGLALVASLAEAQPAAVHLKGWNAVDSSRPAAPTLRKTRSPGRSHYLVQFSSQPGADQISALTAREASALSYVPDLTLSVSMRDGTDLTGLGVAWVGQLQPVQKISPRLSSALGSSQAAANPSPPVLVEFYSDVPDADARAIVADAGASVHDNPDLLPHHLLIEGTVGQVRQLADWDEVSYIFPASAALVQGVPVYGCAGALTSAGPVGQAVPVVGDGWAGPSHGSANLSYSFVYLTPQDPADQVESEIERAYAEWANYVQVSFTQTNNPNAAQTLAVLFATGPHGDGYPFSSTTTLAHTFYPYPLNPEPIAGDQHFNSAESWKIGATVDVYSVALHETGHALGLGHSDDPADVMYPYYQMETTLGAGDIAAIQQQYAPVVPGAGSSNPNSPTPTPAPSPTATPLSLTIQPPPSTTTASTIALSGTAAGGSGAVTVSWSTNQGAAGTAQGSSSWTIGAIPLNQGANVITVTAQDAKQNQASASVTVTEQTPPTDTPISGGSGGTPPSNPPSSPTTPSSNSGSPPAINILSPPMTIVATSSGSIIVSGTAQSSIGVAEVTWSTSTGGSGVASGTNSWTTGPISLYQGMTTIMIYATDTAGNQAWRSINVTQN